MKNDLFDLLSDDSELKSVCNELDSLGIVNVYSYNNDYSVDNLKNVVSIVKESDNFVKVKIKEKGWDYSVVLYFFFLLRLNI